MDQPTCSDDELIETTIKDNTSDHTDDDDDAPAASGTMMLAEQTNYTDALNHSSMSTLSYTGTTVLSILSWIGSGLYSLTNIFGSAATQEEQHMHVLNTIAKLNNHLIFLDKKIDSMNRNSTRFSQQAKMLYRSKKFPSAMHQIRLKKMYDCEIGKLEKLKFNIESNILHMDSVEIMMVTVDTIKDTSDHFQKINSTLNIEKLEDTIEELVEHRDAATDIQSVLSDMQLFNDANYDEEDLMKELQMMVGDDGGIELDKDTINNTGTITSSSINIDDFPEAPSTAFQHPEKITDGKITDGKITEGKITEGKITENTTTNPLELSAVF